MIAILKKLFAPRNDTAHQLYGAIVSQARRPGFYRDLEVPDSLDGRFDMIVLFAALLFRNLRRHPGGPELAQETFDLMFQDMDRSLREMGVGDLAVPRRIRAMGEAFYGRAQAYEDALACNAPDDLATALARNIYGLQEHLSGAAAPARLAAYVLAADARLAAQSFADIVANGPDFPALETAQEGKDAAAAG